MVQAINAYKKITVDPDFRELERQRSIARHNETTALRHARDQEREIWLGVVADKDAAIADQAAAIAGKDAENERLRALIAQLQAKAEA